MAVDSAPTLSGAELELRETLGQALVENFKRLWATKDWRIVKEIVDPEADAHWSGLPTFRGHTYPEHWRRTVTEALPGLEAEITGHAVEGDLVFISWRAQATVNGEQVSWDGIDRFRVNERGLGEEVHAIYDTAVVSEAVAAGVAAAQAAAK